MPYTLKGAIKELKVAEAIQNLQFYVYHTDGNTQGFNARCSEALNAISEVDKFVEELNDAIADVRRKWLEKSVKAVKAEYPEPRIS